MYSLKYTTSELLSRHNVRKLGEGRVSSTDACDHELTQHIPI